MEASFEAQLFLSPSTDDILVPSVVDQEQSAAEQVLEDAGLEVGIVTTETSETVLAGNVISQDPGAGNSLPPGTPVDLVVSTGPAQVEVEDPVGLSGPWYDPAFNGEGYEVMVTSVGVFVYYYGNDSQGRRLWLVSGFYDGPIVYGQSITLTLSRGSGTFDDPSHELEEWGTIIIIFDSCGFGRVQLTGADGTKRADIQKLINIGDLDCDL